MIIYDVLWSLWVKSLDDGQWDGFFLVHDTIFYDLNLKTIQCYFCHILLVETVMNSHLISKAGSAQSSTVDGSMLTSYFKKSILRKVF